MSSLQATMQDYFRGEYLEALWFILPAGVFSIFGALLLLKAERSGFVIGFSVPCIVLGLALLVTGGTVAWRTDSQVLALAEQLQAVPWQFAKEETARMAKVNAAWPVYLACWVGFIVIGLGLRFALKADWAQGLAISLMLFGGLGMVIDGFAERRARPYTEAVQAFAKTQGQAAKP